MTKSRRTRLGVGALMIGIPASAAAIRGRPGARLAGAGAAQIKPQSRIRLRT